MIKDFRALLNDTQEAMHHVTIYNGTREVLKHKSRNKTYILDEQLHTMELCIYHGIKVQVEGLEGERISQICRCTGSQSWRGGHRQNNWVWVKQHQGSCYGIAYTGLSRRWRFLVQPEAEMSGTVGGGDVLYSPRRRCLVQSEMEMSCMAGDGDVPSAQR